MSNFFAMYVMLRILICRSREKKEKHKDRSHTRDHTSSEDFNSERQRYRKPAPPDMSQRTNASYRHEPAEGRTYGGDTSSERWAGASQTRDRFSNEHKRERFEGYQRTAPGYHRDREHRPSDKRG